MRTKGDSFVPVHVVERGGVFAYRIKGWKSGVYRSLGIAVSGGKAAEKQAHEKAWAEYRKSEELRTGTLLMRNYCGLFYGPDCPHVTDAMAENKVIGQRARYQNVLRFKKHLEKLTIMGLKVCDVDHKAVIQARKEIIQANIAATWAKLKKTDPAAPQPQAPGYIAKVNFDLLRTYLIQAHKDGLIPTNPLVRIKRINAPCGKRRELTPEQTKDFFTRENFRSDLAYAVFKLAYLTGMRRNEVLALTQEQFAYQTIKVIVGDKVEERTVGTLKIDRAWKDENLTVIGPPKWGKVRELPVSKELDDHLKWWMKSRPFDHSPLIFHGPGAHPLSTGWWTTNFRFALKNAGIKGVVPHSLRHTIASDLSAAGVPQKVIMGALGWTSEEVADIYIHASADRSREAMDAGFQKIMGTGAS